MENCNLSKPRSIPDYAQISAADALAKLKLDVMPKDAGKIHPLFGPVGQGGMKRCKGFSDLTLLTRDR